MPQTAKELGDLLTKLADQTNSIDGVVKVLVNRTDSLEKFREHAEGPIWWVKIIGGIGVALIGVSVLQGCYILKDVMTTVADVKHHEKSIDKLDERLKDLEKNRVQIVPVPSGRAFTVGAMTDVDTAHDWFTVAVGKVSEQFAVEDKTACFRDGKEVELDAYKGDRGKYTLVTFRPDRPGVAERVDVFTSAVPPTVTVSPAK